MKSFTNPRHLIKGAELAAHLDLPQSDVSTQCRGTGNVLLPTVSVCGKHYSLDLVNQISRWFKEQAAKHNLELNGTYFNWR